MRKLSVVLMAATLVFVATVEADPVQYGVVGGGIHQVYGGGNGIASESYDWYLDWPVGWDDIFPAAESGTPHLAPSGFPGYLLLALNPYTGEVWTDVPLTHQANNPGSSYVGHAPDTLLPGGDWVSNLVPSATGLLEDCIFITTEYRWDGSYGAFGAFVTVSSDGAVLGTPDGYGGHAGIDSHLPNNLGVGTAIEPAGAMEWTNDLYGHVGWWAGYYAGTDGGGTGNYGFEMDGIKGWISLNFAGNRSGVRLNEYYFDVPEPATMSLLAIGGIAALIRRKK